MEKLNNPSELNLIFRYALKDLSRNYKKLSSIIVTLFISLFILSAIFTIEDSLKKELNDNAKALLGGDLEIDPFFIPALTTILWLAIFFLLLNDTGKNEHEERMYHVQTVQPAGTHTPGQD